MRPLTQNVRFQKTKMIDINGKKYCCFLTGTGVLSEVFSGENPLNFPEWIQNQGKFNIEDKKWDIAVGISHEDEEWRQDDDIKDFMIECFSFIDDIMSEGGSLTLVMAYTNAGETMCSISSSTAGLLSSLNIDLEIHWMYDQ
jgi:hypothetical protein